MFVFFVTAFTHGRGVVATATIPRTVRKIKQQDHNVRDM